MIHFERAINEELEVTPNDKSLNRLKEGIGNIIKEGKEVKILTDSKEKRLQLKEIENKLHELTKLKSENRKTNTLVQRIVKHKNDLLRFVNHTGVEFHNNRAERTIRAAVIFRKISFGNRTPVGAQNYAILCSVLETCRLKGKKLVSFLLEAWQTPNDHLHILTKSLLDTS